MSEADSRKVVSDWLLRTPARPYVSARQIPLWYYWVCGFFLLDSMQAFGFISRMVYGNWMGKPGDKITQSLNLLMIVSSLMLFAYNYQRNRRLSLGAGMALATIGFLFLTALWSTDWTTTVREASVYLFVIFGTIGVAGTLGGDEYMRLLRMTCFLAAIGSLVLLVISPVTAYMADGGGVQGLFAHKNFLGQVMATGALACLHSMHLGCRQRGRNLLMLFVFIVVALASRSTTSWLIIFVFSGITGIVALYRKRGAGRLVAVLLVVILTPLLLVAAADPDPLLEMIGKDPTLTGRTEIWAYVIDNIWMKPVLGWGYFGFWLVTNPAAMKIADAEGWFVPEAHNGLLEMLLNVGVVGTAIFIFLFVRNLVFAFRDLQTPANALAISTITHCIGILLLGISENVLLMPTQPSTIVFFITGLMCEQAARMARLQRTHRKAPRGYSGSLAPRAAAQVSRLA